jgi:hypothetical protein
MKKILIILVAAGFIMGLVGASVALADGTNGNTNSGSGNTNTGGGAQNVSWGFIHCKYSDRPGSCTGTPTKIPVDPDDKTSG